MVDKTTYSFGTPPATGGSGSTGGPGISGGSGGTGGPASAYDMAILQVRRTTSYILTNSYNDISFDIVDIENDFETVELDDSNSDRILIKEDGVYEISYDFAPLLSTEAAVNSRIRIDDDEIVPGSQIEFPMVNKNMSTGISRMCVVDLLAGEYVTLQMGSDYNGGYIADLSLRVIKLDQTIGDTGNSGGSGGSGGTGATSGTGDTGGTGNTGNTGGTGNTGSSGGTGDLGLTGNTGSTGGTGNTGAIGITGGTGDIGSSGGTGEIGSSGGIGVTGGTGGIGGTGANNYSGFPNRTDSIISLTGDLFEISPTSTSFDVYAGGKIWSKTSTDSLNITDVIGIHFIFYDIDGVLKQSTTIWDISGDIAPVAVIYWNGDAGRLTEERHSYTRNKEWHHWAHDTIGARYGYGLDAVFTNTTLSIQSGSIYDEDIETEWDAQTSCIIWYRSGINNMSFINTPSNTPYIINGNTIRYDNEGTLTDVAINNYVNMWIYGTNDMSNQIYSVLGQSTYSNLASAQSENMPLLPISSAEWKLLYRVTFRATSGTPTYIESYDYRVVSSGPVINSNSSQFPIASNVLTNITSFDGILSASDATVQAALETLDDHTHPTLTGGTGGTGNTGNTGSIGITGGTGGVGVAGTSTYDISIPMNVETVTSESYVILRTFIFRGTDDLNCSPIDFVGIVSQEVSDSGGNLQLYDLTNDLEIAIINFSFSDTIIHKVNSSSISNVPSGEAIWQVRSKVTTAGNDIYIQGAHISH